jgi:cytidylate kinase
MKREPVVTLDGPAGSGKSTTAREVARRLGFRHLDSGALYRALTFALMESGVPEGEWPELSREALDRYRIWLRPNGSRFEVMLGDRVLTAELRTPHVTEKVSPLSAIPVVREWLLDAQRQAGREGALVADGRDMGTVVFPDAELKVFLTADLEQRAHRRFLEREGRTPSEVELKEETERIQTRDERDSGRAHAPLREPDDAVVVDTSHLTFEVQVDLIIGYVKKLDGSLG